MSIIANTRLFNTRSEVELFSPVHHVSNGNFYMFVGRHLPWANSTPDSITETVRNTDYTIFDQMIFGKHVEVDDVKQMIDRYDWVSGTVYAMYDDQDPDLYTKNFFVVSPEGGNYHIFKCIDNNDGAPSTSQPLFSETLADDEVYMTADDYHWKYMYTIDSSTWQKFATNAYVPVVPNNQVTSFATNGSIDNILLTLGGNNYISYATGFFTDIAVGGNSSLYAVDTGSSNSNFFTGCALYIRSGTGAGQVRDVTYYDVVGTQYRVGVDTPFDPQPDLSSQYQLAPNVKIAGDGTGAKAISIVNNGTITMLHVINAGRDYSYANVAIIGNTGTVSANSASARAIISPKGGHGADVYQELNANKVGFSITFANSESGLISTNNDFTQIGLIKDPAYSNVAITYNANTGLFQDGEVIVQGIGVNTAVSLITATAQQYTYNVTRYLTITVSGTPAFAAGDQIYQQAPTSVNGTVIAVSGSNLIVKNDYGIFTNLDGIQKIGSPSTNNIVDAISQGFSNTVYGLDTVANTSLTLSATNSVEVFVNGQEIPNRAYLAADTETPCFSTNTTAVIFSNLTLANSDIVQVNKYVQTALITNTQISAYGTVSSIDTASQVLYLTDVVGQFIANTTITGGTSGVSANVAGISGQSSTFKQTTRLTIQYDSGSPEFALDDYIEQEGAAEDEVDQDNAFGYVQDIETANATHYYLDVSGVKGTFQVGYPVTGNSHTISANVVAVTPPDLIKYSGNIIYAENVNSVSRANNQSETIKLVLKYF